MKEGMREDYPYSVEISISGESGALKTALLSLEPEQAHTDRTLVELEIREENLIISIFATDSTALRAAVNSYLRWLNEAFEVYEKTVKRN